MTQEEKQLFRKDLYARLPYGVICQFIWTYSNETTNGEDVIAIENDNIRCISIHTEEIQADYYGEWVDLEHCKPYLRPMSSMTEEEIKEYNTAIDKDTIEINKTFETPSACMVGINALDWLNAHHFDYRGLIEKGLALKAPEGMYKF